MRWTPLPVDGVGGGVNCLALVLVLNLDSLSFILPDRGWQKSGIINPSCYRLISDLKL